MIQLTRFSFSRATRTLIDNASLQIHPGWKVGLVGANGTGKSSLFATLRGELEADSGSLELPAHWRLAHVAQETPALTCSALNYTLDGDDERRKIEAQLLQAEARGDGAQIGLLHGRLQEIDAYAAPARAEALLTGLGFSAADSQRPVAEFSGGWRMRLNLAQALMSRADLLLLDEPTNHLDLDAVIWLEQWLAQYHGCVILISHDRHFLDATVHHILHLYQTQLKLYTGNYSAFELARAEALTQQQAMFDKQQRQRQHLQTYIDRFRAQATKARQAQSRIKMLERMQTLVAAHVDSAFSFSFEDPQKLPDPMLVIEHANVKYDHNTILNNVSITIRPNARIGILGRNGAGKSSLMKLVAGKLGDGGGNRVEAKELAVGYFTQHQLEALRADESPLAHLIRREPQSREQDLLNYLGGFGFHGDMAISVCGTFSGGEKSRLALALLIRSKPNLLLLDEPTNHLDLDMRHALNMALQNFSGSLMLISHDRNLLESCCDEFLWVDQQKACVFDGDLEDYQRRLTKSRQQANRGNTAVAGDDKQQRTEQREQAKQERQTQLAARRPLLAELKKLEARLEKAQAERDRINARLGDEQIYQAENSSELQQLLKTQGETNASIDADEERWLVLHDELEVLGDID